MYTYIISRLARICHLFPSPKSSLLWDSTVLLNTKLHTQNTQPLFCILLYALSLWSGGHTVFAQEEEIIIYVDDGTDNDNTGDIHTYGKSWSMAFRYQKDAIHFGAPNATQIWIAECTYYPDKGLGSGGKEA